MSFVMLVCILLVLIMMQFSYVNVLGWSRTVVPMRGLTMRQYIGRRRLTTAAKAPAIVPVSPVNLGTDSYNRRYWSKSVNIGTISNSRLSLVEAVENILKAGSAEDKVSRSIIAVDFSKSEQGMVVAPAMGIMIPIHDGRLQVQHVTYLSDEATAGDAPAHTVSSPTAGTTVSNQQLIFCGFASRAQHIIAASEDERPVHIERQQALLAAMDKFGAGVTESQLLSADYAGTPPARIYRSFVCPRARTEKITPNLDSVVRAAERTAEQIKFAVRQLRADQADYLRNIDRPTSDALNGTSFASSSNTANAQITATNSEGENSKGRKVPVLHPVVLVLDNIRSANNVGSMFRTAETAGAAEIITCGITAHPPHPKLRKTAMQSIDVVLTRHFDDLMKAIETLKLEGYTIVVMETTSLSKQYTAVQYPAKVALVLGNEVTGVDTRIVQLADLVVEIPTYGVKNSLNVAAAAPIVLFEVIRQWHLNG